MRKEVNMSTVADDRTKINNDTLLDRILNEPIPRRFTLKAAFAVTTLIAGTLAWEKHRELEPLRTLEEFYNNLCQASSVINTRDFKDLKAASKINTQTLQAVVKDMQGLKSAVQNFIMASDGFIESYRRKGLFGSISENLHYVTINKSPEKDPLKAIQYELQIIESCLSNIPISFSRDNAMIILQNARQSEAALSSFELIAKSILGGIC